MKDLAFFEMPVIVFAKDKEMLHSIYMTLLTNGFKKIFRASSLTELYNVPELDYSVVFFDAHLSNVEEEKEIVSSILSALLKSLVVVAVDGSGSECASSFLNAGVFDYMVKPIDETRLLTSISNAIKLVQIMKENKKLRSSCNGE